MSEETTSSTVVQGESAFSHAWEGLHNRGYSILPIEPGTKRPGLYDPDLGRWKPRLSWNDYFARLMNDTEIDAAATWPGCGIGVCLGGLSGVIALDLDAEGDLATALLEIMPPSPVAKVGAKGLTRFYRFNGEHSKNWHAEGSTALELLSDNRQTVIPPTMHPQTNTPYYWAGESLTDVEKSDLPTLPGDFLAKVQEVIGRYNGRESGGSGAPMGDTIKPFDLGEGDVESLREALTYLDPDPQDNWVRVGMALTSIGDVGFDLWDEWSQRSDKYAANRPGLMRKRWNGWEVREGGLTYKTLLRDAKQLGWQSDHVFGPDLNVTPSMDTELGRVLLAGELKKGNAPEQFGYTASEVEPLTTAKGRSNQVFSRYDLDKNWEHPTPQPQFVVEKIIPRGTLTGFGGHGGIGKTYISLVIGAHVACGTDLAGLQVQSGRVLFVSMEDPPEWAHNRLRAICAAYELDEGEVRCNVKILDGSHTNSALAQADSASGIKFTVAMDELEGQFPDYDLVIIDGASDAFMGNENVRNEVTAFLKRLRSAAQQGDTALMLIMHIDKSAARGNGAGNNYSGSTAWHNTARSRLAVIEVDGGAEIHHEKCNLGDKAKTLSVVRRNGVPIVAEGKSTHAQIFSGFAEDKIPDAIMSVIQTAVADGNDLGTRTEPGNGAPFSVLEDYPEWPEELRGPDGRRKAGSYIRRLRKDGRLETESYKNSQRKPKERLVIADGPSAPVLPDPDE